MKQSIYQQKCGLSARELRELVHITPETVAPAQPRESKPITAARYWSIERSRTLAADRRRTFLVS